MEERAKTSCSAEEQEAWLRAEDVGLADALKQAIEAHRSQREKGQGGG